MTNYAPQNPGSAGVALTMNAAAGGGTDRVPAGCTLIIRNTSGSGITVTLATPLLLDGDLTVADRTSASVAATTGLNALKIPNNEVYRDPADGLVGLTWSATSGVTFGVIS